MIDYSKISDIFCLVDEFCKDFDQTTSSIRKVKRSSSTDL